MRSDDLGKLILRLALGILLLLHGVAKLGHGVDGIGQLLAARGLPSLLAYGVYLGEVVAPVLVILGLFTRPAALVIVVNMLAAIWLAHAGQLGSLTANGGWALELQGLYLFGALALALLGGGRLSVGGRYN